MRILPDFNISKREATDFILDCHLARKAMQDTYIPQLANVLRDLIEQIHYLALSCHLAEFTDHGLSHICSVIGRLSDWAYNTGWLNTLKENEATLLLGATIIHDIGMLSQMIEDLDEGEKFPVSKDLIDWPTWVRNTHERRIFGIIRRVLLDKYPYEEQFRLISRIAKGHRVKAFEWEKKKVMFTNDIIRDFDLNRIIGLSSAITVADELDEDSERCKTEVLLQHRNGNLENKAHWIRHGLTGKRIEIFNKSIDNHKKEIVIKINFCRPANISDEIKEKFIDIYTCLRNHFRLVLLYNEFLHSIDAKIDSIIFEPEIITLKNFENVEINPGFGCWEKDDTLKLCLPELIISTFSNNARSDYKDGDKNIEENCKHIGIESVAIKPLVQLEPNTQEEITYKRLLNWEGLFEQ